MPDDDADMRRHTYSFSSRWRVHAPLHRCWGFLTTPGQQWRDWWPRLRSIEIYRTGDLVGSRARCAWQSPVGYMIRNELLVTEVVPHEMVRLRTYGDLDGEAVVRFAVADGGGSGDMATEIEMAWHVCTTRTWMNWAAPLLRPVFRWGHSAVMRGGEKGLNVALSTPPPGE